MPISNRQQQENTKIRQANRPPFERMIGQLERAKLMWDTPYRSLNDHASNKNGCNVWMRPYSISLLKLVKLMLDEEINREG